VPGELGGAALADVLFGDTEPTGRLPISLPRRTGQVPLHHDTRAGGGRSLIYGDYVDAPSSPQFPFGFGLGYTTFGYEELEVESAAVLGELVVRVAVRNTGDRAGEEVVQLYVRDETARVARPQRQLAGFARVALAPDQRRLVTFHVPTTQLAYYDDDMRLVVEPGDVRVMLGGLEATTTVTGVEREIGPNDRVPTTVAISA
jgi:beta-glucosidase